MKRSILLLPLLSLGCSVVFDLETYDQTTSISTSASVSGSTSTSSSGGSGGSGGEGGVLDCGNFVNPPVSSVLESFDAGLGTLAPHGGCTFAEAGSVLFGLPDLPVLDYCWIALPGVYHLTCDSLTFRLLEATSPVLGAQTYVYFSDLTTGAETNFILEGGGYALAREDGTGSLDIMNGTYNPNADRYLRFRADQDTMYFETSTDGSSWTLRGSGPFLMPLDNLQVRIGAGSHSALMTDPGQARIDCLNVTPCP